MHANVIVSKLHLDNSPLLWIRAKKLAEVVAFVSCRYSKITYCWMLMLI